MTGERGGLPRNPFRRVPNEHLEDAVERITQIANKDYQNGNVGRAHAAADLAIAAVQEMRNRGVMPKK